MSTIINCDHCGKTFQTYLSVIKKYKNHFCSQDCRNQWRTGRTNNKSSKYYTPKIGETIGHITLLKQHEEYDNQNHKRIYYICQCTCGKTIKRRIDYLRKIVRDNINASCGCKNPIHGRGKNSVKWKGFGDIPKSFFDGIRLGARNRNIEFNISIEDMWNQLIQQNHKCKLTNLDIQIQQSRTESSNPTTASLDRIDSNLAYTKDNIQWVHKTVNKMKNNLTQQEFIEFCRLVSEHHS